MEGRVREGCVMGMRKITMVMKEKEVEERCFIGE